MDNFSNSDITLDKPRLEQFGIDDSKISLLDEYDKRKNLFKSRRNALIFFIFITLFYKIYLNDTSIWLYYVIGIFSLLIIILFFDVYSLNRNKEFYANIRNKKESYDKEVEAYYEMDAEFKEIALKEELKKVILEAKQIKEYGFEIEGWTFEKAIAKSLEYLGFTNVKVTQGVFDYAINIGMIKDNKHYIVQCENWKNSLSPDIVLKEVKTLYKWHSELKEIIETDEKKRKELEFEKKLSEGRQIKEHWLALDGLPFEKEVAKLFKACGFNDVEVTAGSGDYGVDIRMRKDGKRYIVQCKNWKTPVSPDVVIQLFGSLHAENANKAIIIGSGGFSANTIKFANGKPIEFIDIDKLLEIAKTKIYSCLSPSELKILQSGKEYNKKEAYKKYLRGEVYRKRFDL